MLKIGEQSLLSRLILGTAQYPSLQILHDAIIASETEVITVSLKRQSNNINNAGVFWESIKSLNCKVLPNTAGCRNAKEAIQIAEIAREIFATHWIKLEVIGDDYNLQPDPFELLNAAKILIANGFEVFPYCTDDLVLCQRLRDTGCRILMPWAAPIGTGRGILNPYALETLRARLSDVVMIVDAGMGKPSHATTVMEMGFDGVLLNTAVSNATHPVLMASAFRDAVRAGHDGYKAGLMSSRHSAHPSTPLMDTLFWHQEVP